MPPPAHGAELEVSNSCFRNGKNYNKQILTVKQLLCAARSHTHFACMTYLHCVEVQR